jgi:phosphate transport system ATP-binding protein
MIYLSQHPAIFPGSVFKNVASALEYWWSQHPSTSPGTKRWFRGRVARSELEDRVESALRGVALWDEVKDRLHKDAAILSTGQRQRLCLARALALHPRVLLLDEPTANLDPITIERVEFTLAELKIDYTILIVTHNMQQAARTSDHALNMYLGELVEFDETERIFTHPRERRTEDFITGRYG